MKLFIKFDSVDIILRLIIKSSVEFDMQGTNLSVKQKDYIRLIYNP